MIKIGKLLAEIGDASIKPSPYTKNQINSDKLVYNFNVQGQEYRVTINEFGDNGEDIMFDFNKVESPEDTYLDTNLGHQYRILSTVVAIMKEYIKEHPDTKELTYIPVKTQGEDDSRREKLYKAYIQKIVPNWKYTKNHEFIILTKPN